MKPLKSLSNKRIASVWAVLLACLIIIPHAAAEPVRLEQPGGVVDAGEVWEGDTKQIVLSIRNPGAKPVSIASVEAGCHCSKVDPFFDRIPAKTTVPLRVTLDAAGLQGELERTVAIYAVGMTAPVLTAKYKIVVKPIFTAEPAVLEFKPGEAKKQVLIKRWHGAGKVVSVASNKPGIHSEIKAAEKGVWGVTVTVDPSLTSFMSVVTVTTDDPIRKALGVLITR